MKRCTVDFYLVANERHSSCKFYVFLVVTIFITGWSLFSSISIIIFGVCLIPSVLKWIHHLRNPAGTILCHWGWLDDRELIQGTGLHAIKVSLDSVSFKIWDEETIEINGPKFNSLLVGRSLFRDTGRFDAFLEASRAKSVISERGASENETVGNR